MSVQKLNTPTTTDNSLSPSIKWYKNSSFCLIFKGSCLKAFASPTIIVFFVYELDTWLRHLNSDFTLKDYIFKGVKLPKNIDPDKLYTSYSIGFGLRSEFSLLDIN